MPHKTERNFGHEMPVLVCLPLVPLLSIYTYTGDTRLGFFCSKDADCHLFFFSNDILSNSRVSWTKWYPIKQIFKCF